LRRGDQFDEIGQIGLKPALSATLPKEKAGAKMSESMSMQAYIEPFYL